MIITLEKWQEHKANNHLSPVNGRQIMLLGKEKHWYGPSSCVEVKTRLVRGGQVVVSKVPLRVERKPLVRVRKSRSSYDTSLLWGYAGFAGVLVILAIVVRQLLTY